MAKNTATAKDAIAVEFGRRGGKARMASLSPEERKRIARLAAQARWKKPSTTPSGPDGGGEPQNGQVDGVPVIGHYP